MNASHSDIGFEIKSIHCKRVLGVTRQPDQMTKFICGQNVKYLKTVHDCTLNAQSVLVGYGPILPLVQFLFSFVFVYGNV